MLDVSGSMEGKNEGTLEAQVARAAARAGGGMLGSAIGGTLGSFVGKQASSEATKLGGAKRELIPAIQGLDESARFTVITFGNKAQSRPRGMVTASAGSKNQAVAFVKGLEASGGTPAQKALEEAFGQPEVGVIFFVSDGQPTDAGAEQILGRVRGLNAGGRVRVFTVGLGDDQDAHLLEALARQNGGSYVRR